MSNKTETPIEALNTKFYEAGCSGAEMPEIPEWVVGCDESDLEMNYRDGIQETNQQRAEAADWNANYEFQD